MTNQAHSKAQLVTDHSKWAAGAQVRVGLFIELEPGWHTYWINPGDSGAPMSINWSLSHSTDLDADIKVSDLQFPSPKRVTSEPVTTFGFEDQVLVWATLTVPEGARENLTLKADAEWLVCKDVCIPATFVFAANYPVSELETDPRWARMFDEVASLQPKPLPKDIKVNATAQENQIHLSISSPRTLNWVDSISYPNSLVANQKPQVTHPGPPLKLLFNRSPKERLQSEKVDVMFSHRLADGQLEHWRIQTPIESSPLLWMLALAWLGGLLLNLMPCVFPLLSLKVMSILKSQVSPHSQSSFKEALGYTAGILLTMWALVLTLFFLRSGGADLGWGFQLQSPIFLTFLIWLFFLLALQLFGWLSWPIAIQGPLLRWSRGSAFTNHFFTGVLSTLVATPCTAPFMGAALGFALGQSLPVQWLVFTSLGLGLATPYIVIGINPRLLAWLPKPGPWMNSLKEFFAFPMLATMIWLFWVLSFQTSREGLIIGLSSLVLATFGLWCGKFTTKIAKRFGLLVLVASLGLALISTPPLSSAPPPSQADLQTQNSFQWEDFSLSKLKTWQTEGRTFFVDFTAAWCITCQVNKKMVFQSEKVYQALKNRNIHWMRADWTNRNPEISQVLAQYQRAGVPFYLYFPGGGDPPRILPEVLTPERFLSEIEGVTKQKEPK